MYSLVAYSCFALATLGPLMPFLRSELGLSYSVGAYHFSAWASGGLTAGLIGDRVIRRLGRRRALWTFATGISCGISFLIFAHHPVLTIFGALLAGFSSSTMGQTITTIASDRFGRQRTIAIAEFNVIGSVIASIAPLVIGFLVKSGIGWRAALVLPMVAYILIFVSFFKKQAIPPLLSQDDAKQGWSLPPLYWAYWIVIFLSVAAEWSIVFWCAEFMERHGGLARADASQTVAAFQCAMFMGRLAGCRLAHSADIRLLLPISAIIAIAGFMVFWLVTPTFFCLAGLFVAGLGIANLYPLTFAAALGTVPQNSATATARMSISTGSAILSAPLILGFIADRTSLFEAYGVVACLLALAGVTAVLGTQSGQRREQMHEVQSAATLVAEEIA